MNKGKRGLAERRLWLVFLGLELEARDIITLRDKAMYRLARRGSFEVCKVLVQVDGEPEKQVREMVHVGTYDHDAFFYDRGYNRFYFSEADVKTRRPDRSMYAVTPVEEDTNHWDRLVQAMRRKRKAYGEEEAVNYIV